MSRNIFEPDDMLAHQQVKVRKKRTTRADKASAGQERAIREKFIEERVLPPLRPLNDLQAKYIKLIQEKKLVVATGFAGTSKTYIPTVMACDAYRKGEISKIYLSRAAMSESKSLG